MNTNELEDLKQFIGKRFDELSQKMDDGFAGVGEALEEMNSEADRAHTILNRRLVKLERTQTA